MSPFLLVYSILLNSSIATLVQMVGLTAMPLIAYAAISFDGWRMGWIIIRAALIICYRVVT